MKEETTEETVLLLAQPPTGYVQRVSSVISGSWASGPPGSNVSPGAAGSPQAVSVNMSASESAKSFFILEHLQVSA